MLSEAVIQAAVDRAFQAAGELALDATWFSDAVSGYDWSTQLEVGTTNPSVQSKVIKAQETSTDSNVILTVFVKEREFPGSLYTRLQLGSDTFLVSRFQRYPGLVEVELAKP